MILDQTCAYYNQLSISKKFSFISLSTLLLAGITTIFLSLIYQYVTDRDYLESETQTLGQIVSESIAPAIIFNDNIYIETTLKSLKHKKRLKDAFALDIENKLIAEYHQGETSSLNKDLLFDTLEINVWDGLLLYSITAIMQDNKQIGSLVIVASMEEFLLSSIKKVLALILIVGVSILLTFRYRAKLISMILKPISVLNDSTNEIIRTNNLDLKIQKYSNDEIGKLAENFNIMIQNQLDIQLKLKESHDKVSRYNDELEERVEERTKELNLLNQELDQRVKREVHKRAEQEQILIQQSRFAAMGEMIGNIAHQWRQPLNALGLLMQNIEFAYETDTLDEAYIKRVVKKGNNLTLSMSKTIDDFRNFFKVSKKFEVFSYAKAYKETIAILGSTIENNMIEIQEEIDESVCVNGLIREFSQVIVNILNNAKDVLVENKKEQKIIKVKIYKDAENAYFCIEDNAGGIKEDIIKKIFDPYFTTKDEGKGTGIGLYMSKTIIEGHMKGTLSAQNTKFGACFTVKMKLHPCIAS